MIQEFGDIWEMEGDAIVITTNGTVRRDGACVMGRGIAAQAKERYPGIEYDIGRSLSLWGNGVGHLYVTRGAPPLITRDFLYWFPVKHHWREPADLTLIKSSARELVGFADFYTAQRRILVPRPGCGNGSRTWAEVEPILAPILDDRFVIVTYSPSDR